jgi:hypothetical protein
MVTLLSINTKNIPMLKPLYLSAAVSVAALIASIPQIVFSRPVSETSGYPSVLRAQAGSLVCYMQTPQGQIVDLRSLCVTGASANTPAVNVGNSNPADNAGRTNNPPNQPSNSAGVITNTTGRVTNSNSTPQNSATPSGTIIGPNGQTTGIIGRDGTIVTPRGQATGIVNSDGTIINPRGQATGVINRDGTIVSPGGTSTGTLAR